jgi:DNA-binding HxlR family transcriptional regulator
MPTTAPKTLPKRRERPIMALVHLLGKKWVMRIVWELRDGPLNFRALQEACGQLSPSSLNARLKDLTAKRLVESTVGEGYALTSLGRELLAHFLPLHDWSERWAAQVDRDMPSAQPTHVVRKFIKKRAQ